MRITTPCTQRSRFRATSATGSRVPRATSGRQASTDRRRTRGLRPRTSSSCEATACRTAAPRAGQSSAVGRRRTGPERALSLEPRGQREAGLQLLRREIEDRQEAAGHRRLFGTSRHAIRLSHDRETAHVRYSPLMRTYSALRSQVHTVALRSAAGSHIDLDVDLAAAQIVRGLRRRFVIRLSVLEQNDGADPHQRTFDRERRRRSGRRRRPDGPSWDRRRAPRSSRAASWQSPSRPAARSPPMPAPVTVIDTSLVAPSPPRTITSASVRQTRPSIRRRAPGSCALRDRHSARAARQHERWCRWWSTRRPP